MENFTTPGENTPEELNAQNALNQDGFDSKNRAVKLSVTDDEIIVTKDGCDHFTESFEDYEAAEEYFIHMCSCSHN